VAAIYGDAEMPAITEPLAAKLTTELPLWRTYAAALGPLQTLTFVRVASYRICFRTMNCFKHFAAFGAVCGQVGGL